MADTYSASTIAKWFVAWADDEDALTNMKLQKLLYYAQGHHLARYGRPLFDDEIQAWSHGPVVPSVYRQFKRFGAAPLELRDEDAFSWDDVDSETADYLGQVWNSYGGFTAARLRNMSHDEGPWIAAWGQGDSRDSEIGLASMTSFFESITV
ncbi:Panacea domain-containing protein [Rhodococcus artemisiae]|uniref:DUF4065 domain-containing protein n=1 Tax=Rhodococcus artemisiae TaxID=714159 RepID=A0ABU7L9R2_9NOCA|nr:type II toxin-antitoxin system antitoxin SocA domain-containing protein [Rhodococcus artemisiae]MEE2058276.1 DUF4065 domain-containing protein [Rhodococcus artemisiae]